jgi:hypothetical protein
MAMPASMFELEIPVEDRVARFEEKVEHIQSDVSRDQRQPSALD